MKQIRLILGTVILIMVVTFNMSFASNAYTEEQKQQAKAWLSAHGYSPDMGGANQAYQDYLNGKFDEELGIDVNGDGIPATTQTTESSTEEDTEEYADADLEDGEGDAEEGDSDTDQDTSDATTGPSGADSAEDNNGTTNDATEDEIVADMTDGEGQTNDSEEVVEQNEEEAECGMEEQKSSKSTLYQPEKQDEYQEGLMVIVLAVVLMLLAGMFMR